LGVLSRNSSAEDMCLIQSQSLSPILSEKITKAGFTDRKKPKKIMT
jgi:hypothetical protein